MNQARADAVGTEAMLKSSAHQGLTGPAVRELAREPRTGLRLGRGGYRRDHVRAVAQHVEVADDAIYINGNKDALLRTLIHPMISRLVDEEVLRKFARSAGGEGGKTEVDRCNNATADDGWPLQDRRQAGVYH